MTANAPSFAIGAWSAEALGLVAFVVAVPTALSYALSAWALRRATPSLVTIYVYLQPLVVTALAWVQLGQPPDVRARFAGLFILGGVTLVATAPRHEVEAPRLGAADYTESP